MTLSHARANETEPQIAVRKNANKQSTSRKRSNETQQEIVERKKNRHTMSTVCLLSDIVQKQWSCFCLY